MFSSCIRPKENKEAGKTINKAAKMEKEKDGKEETKMEDDEKDIVSISIKDLFEENKQYIEII